MCFVRSPSADLKHIWSHGEVPNPAEKALPDCGAKQLLFSRLYAYYTTVVRSMDADTAHIIHALLRQLARLFLLTIFLRPFSRTTIMESSPRPASQILLLTILVRHNLLLTILVSHIFTSAWTANLVCYNRV